MGGVCILGDKAKVKVDAHGCPSCPHPDVTGPAISGSPNVNVNGLPALREGDMGIHAACCGPNMWTPIEASARVVVNGMRLVRQGDKTQHCGGIGEMITASGNVHDNSPNAALILKQLAAIAAGMAAREEGMRELLAANLLGTGDVDIDDLEGLFANIEGVSLETIETLNQLSQHGGLQSYMMKKTTKWMYDGNGNLIGFYSHDKGMHYAYGLDGKRHFLGEDGNAESPSDLTDAILMIGGGVALKAGKKLGGIVLGAGAKAAAPKKAIKPYIADLLEKGRASLKDKVQKARDAIPKNLDDAKARAHNKAIELGTKRPSDKRPGPGPEDAPPKNLKEAGKAVGKEVGTQLINIAKKKYLGD